MFRRLRSYDPGRTLGALLFFRLVLHVTRAALTLVLRLRCFHAERVPSSGPLLVVSNHQSHFDPPLVGVCLARRHIVPIARQGLFNHPVFGWLIRNLNSISINEKEGDAVAIRRAVKELEAGRCVLIFPEGSRSPDGAMRPFKRGVWVLVHRAKCTVLPAAVEGAFDAWPRHRTAPRLWGRRVAVAFGEPVSYDRLLSMGPDAALRFLETEIDSLRMGLRAKLRQASGGTYPAPGPGDEPGIRQDRERSAAGAD